MLLFKPSHVDQVCEGTKTETRRIWARSRVNVGVDHQCYTRIPIARPRPLPFAIIEILEVRVERLGAIRRAGARREGCRDVVAFRNVWRAIHDGQWTPDTEVHVVRFRLARRQESRCAPGPDRSGKRLSRGS